MPKGSTLQMKHLMASSFFQRLGKTFLKILGVPGEVAHAWWRPAGSNSWGCNVIDPPYTTIYSRCLVRCRVLQVLSVSGQSCLCGQDLQRWIEIYGFWNWECLFLSSHQSFHIIFHLYYSSLDSWIKTTSHTHTNFSRFPPPKKGGWLLQKPLVFGGWLPVWPGQLNLWASWLHEGMQLWGSLDRKQGGKVGATFLGSFFFLFLEKTKRHWINDCYGDCIEMNEFSSQKNHFMIPLGISWVFVWVFSPFFTHALSEKTVSRLPLCAGSSFRRSEGSKPRLD